MDFLIIAEKPSAARKIGIALDKNGKPTARKVGKRGEYLEITLFDTGKKAAIASAAGHLYALKKDKNGAGYPIFNFSWVKNDDNKWINNYINVLENLIKTGNFKDFIVATDYDVEGSVIGYNIIRFLCAKNQSSLPGLLKKSRRMKFSNLTRKELNHAWNNLEKTLDCPRIEAGYVRHWIDILFGINLSQALTQSVKTAGKGFKLLSMGRVQGPTLKAVHDRELEIDAHVSKQYWTLNVMTNSKGKPLDVTYSKERIDTKNEALNVKNDCEKKTGKVEDIQIKKNEKSPPPPFNLIGLQREASRLFRLKPSQTLKIAEKLYLETLISYPRTDNEIISNNIDVKAILGELEHANKYKDDAGEIMQLKNLVPSKGKKQDDAHPPIIPTGTIPDFNKLNKSEANVYDLIARRFLSLFGSQLAWQERKHAIHVGKHLFHHLSKSLISEGWTKYYGKYYNTKNLDIGVALERDQEVYIEKIDIIEKFTSPPPRYSDITLLGYMEKEKIGTKSTRAQIIDKLRDRNYIQNYPIQITMVGKKLVDILEKNVPDIISVGLTRDLEQKMDSIMEGKSNMKVVIDDTKKFLSRNLADFKKNEAEIGSELGTTVSQQRKDERILGKCPSCDEKQLILIIGKNKKRWVACQGFFDKTCNVALPIAQTGKIIPTGKTCPKCNFPMVKRISKGKKPWEFCLNWAKCK
ncbi:MAG: DNA topoisomerase I [Candidatus Hodarchaeota archaeon]